MFMKNLGGCELIKKVICTNFHDGKLRLTCHYFYKMVFLLRVVI